MRRIKERSFFLFLSVSISLFVLNVVWVIIGANAGWLDFSEQKGWIFGGAILSGLIGKAVAIVYYTIAAWRDL